jgi:thioredoxin reductase (NADPH)
MRDTDVVVIGGGPAGMSAAIWCNRLGLRTVLLEERSRLGGQLLNYFNPIVDYLGFPGTNGAELQKRFATHVAEAGIATVTGAQVQRIDVAAKQVTYRVAGAPASDPANAQDELIQAHAIILAMGASDRRLWVPGEAELLQRGEVYSASRDRDRFAGRPVAIVGGGDRAFEGALLLAERGADVTLIHRSDKFRARTEFTDPVLVHPRVRIIQTAQVTAIQGDTRIRSITVLHGDGTEEQIAVDALLVRLGVEPHSHLVRGLVETDESDFIVTNRMGQTNAEGVYAIGDICTRPMYSSIATATGQGMITAKAIYQQLQQHQQNQQFQQQQRKG